MPAIKLLLLEIEVNQNLHAPKKRTRATGTQKSEGMTCAAAVARDPSLPLIGQDTESGTKIPCGSEPTKNPWVSTPAATFSPPTHPAARTVPVELSVQHLRILGTDQSSANATWQCAMRSTSVCYSVPSDRNPPANSSNN